ncbi:MAG: alpha-L-fucosidase [Acutalibacteraceae bacterium]|nr:alpha-L-fucosidase [Acutalibacteraceae bacterium]
MLSKPQYEEQIAATRDNRMEWWREARFGMFIHYGLFSQVGRNEWVMACENVPPQEYEKLADTFSPKEGCCREWAKLAKEAGCKYMVMTTRHHEGFSLWDSKANPYNSVNYGPHRDIVKEFVEACREFDLKIGFYSTCMEWHHPDSGICAYDTEARRRYTQFLKDINTELLTQYGKIDILWYDVPAPMESWEGWDSLERNQFLRSLQPDIIINDRSRLDEDFGTPEEHITPSERDWEACMTFNGISWGYVDSDQALPYSYTPQRIVSMLQTCCERGGNLLLNVGPKPDGSIPYEVIDPLKKVGEWLKVNGEAVYGKLNKTYGNEYQLNGVSRPSSKGNTIYMWNKIWAPYNGKMVLGGLFDAPKKISFMDGTPIKFEMKGDRIFLYDLPEENPDPILNIPLIKLEFDFKPRHRFASYFPQLHGGRDDREIVTTSDLW